MAAREVVGHKVERVIWDKKQRALTTKRLDVTLETLESNQGKE